MNKQQAWYQGWPVTKEGPGKGWWGPPKGTHEPGSQGGKGKITIGGISKSEIEKMNRSELEAGGFMPVFRGTNAQGMGEIRPSEGGVGGSGVYFYGDPLNARSYAEREGGIITGFVHPDDVVIHDIPGGPFSRAHKVIILKDPAKFVRRGDIPTEQTTGGAAKLEKIADAALENPHAAGESSTKD